MTLVRMTEEGDAVLVAAAPDHVETVRTLVFDGLAEADVEALGRIMRHVLTRIDSSGLNTTS